MYSSQKGEGYLSQKICELNNLFTKFSSLKKLYPFVYLNPNVMKNGGIPEFHALKRGK